MRVFAPGKLILSGEHAVVYGAPALAIAVNRYAITTIERAALPHVLFQLTNLAHEDQLSLHALRALKNKIKSKYKRFLQGEFSIKQVLAKPFELAQFALSALLDAKRFQLEHGAKIAVHSTIPVGCGMGSSAAIILSVMKAVAVYLNLNLTHDELYRLALEAENMQHGQASGMDLQVSLHGGCVAYANGRFSSRPIPNIAFYLVNAGKPEVSTGQCIERVAPLFKSQLLLSEFSDITLAMDHALQYQLADKLRDAVAANHALLSRIGVVPARVQAFIADLSTHGGVAKICGAGAVTGDAGGMVLVMIDSEKALLQIAHAYGYEVMPIACVADGVHSCEN